MSPLPSLETTPYPVDVTADSIAAGFEWPSGKLMPSAEGSQVRGLVGVGEAETDRRTDGQTAA